MTELVFILDRSGSMSGMESELIGFVPLKEDICKQLIDDDFEERDDW